MAGPRSWATVRNSTRSRQARRLGRWEGSQTETPSERGRRRSGSIEKEQWGCLGRVRAPTLTKAAARRVKRVKRVKEAEGRARLR